MKTLSDTHIKAGNFRRLDLVSYIPARLAEGKRWYVEFYCLDPETERLRRKRVSIPVFKPVRDRRKYAVDMVNALNEKLSGGWNPFMNLNDTKECAVFEDVCAEYCRYLLKTEEADILRPKTYNTYMSFLNGFLRWNDKRAKPVKYVYQLKKRVVSDFLQDIWIKDGLAARTRDNYLMWLRTFVSWLKERNYCNDDPTASLTMLVGRKKHEKNRTVIPKETMLTIRRHLEETNRHFLLACYVIYYCFIRPKEMSHIRLRDISVAKGTIVIDEKWSKNRKTQVVTLPDIVLKLMAELNVFNADSDFYLFSDGFMPGREYKSGKTFGDYWTQHLKRELDLPVEYKFYSLKDTGITNLIKSKADLLSVRDQARHSSLQMTDLYTPMESRCANEELRHRESYF